MKAREIVNSFEEKYKTVEEEVKEAISVELPTNSTNVVSGDRLRQVQSITLANTKEYLSKTFGPMGSNTKIITGSGQADVTSSYSKDGLKVLSNIINSAPIEASIVDELISVTRAVEKEVGDGTTSTVILSSLIFDRLMSIEKAHNIPPFQLCRRFQKVVEEIKEVISSNVRECTLDDIYHIAMVSTNGNEEVSSTIKSIYEQFGMNVDLSVGISTITESVLKVYDGLTITEGYSDPAFINNLTNNTAEIHNARVYHFVDPIDDLSQVALFEAILKNNIYDKYENEEAPIPTVITCPKMSADLSGIMKTLVNQLYQFNNGNESKKPPILLITNVVASDEVIMDDIANLCGCKSIKKYIDQEINKKDIESGVAPTVDTVADFGGYAELVVADAKKTKFINPKHMHVSDDSEELDPVYTSLVNFLETEIAEETGKETANSVGLLKKRLSALKANMVDYLVGGVTIAERDMTKDLVEDAIKNCKSSSVAGVGHAANFEALRAAYIIADKYNNSDANEIDIDIANSILASYVDAACILYKTVELDEAKVLDYVYQSIDNGMPYDISEGILPDIDSKDGDNILCSIKLDCNILDTLSKIITMMVTSNQALLMSAGINLY